MLCGILAGAPPAITATRQRGVAPPRTVVDYYLLLPSKYFAAPLDREWRLGLLYVRKGSIVDNRNGYLHVEADGAQDNLTVCLFRRPDRTYLVAVSGDYIETSWEPFLDFYIYRRGRLVNVTRSTLPRRFSKKLGYQLPSMA